MGRACLCLALFLGCGLLGCGCGGGDETAESESERETESESSSMRGSAAGETAASDRDEAEAPRPNRSAGPARAGFEVVPQRIHRESVHALAVFGRHAAAGTFRGMVTIFDVPSGHVRAARRLFFGPVVSLELSTDRKRLFATGSSSGEDDTPTNAVVWDLELDRVWPVPDHGYGVQRAMSPNGEMVVTLIEQREGIEVHLDTVWGGSRRRQLELKELRRAIFTRNSQALYVATEMEVQRLGLPGLRPVGEAWTITDGGYIVPHPTEDLVAVKYGRAVQVRALADGEVKHELSTDRSIEEIRWSSDGSRLATCARQNARVFGGEGYATVTDLPLGTRRCYQLALDLESEAPATIFTQDRKLTYTPATEGAEPLQLEPHVSGDVVAFPARGDWFLYGSNQDVYIANLTRRRARRLVRGGAGEYSAWSVDGSQDASVTLRGRGWSHAFGAEEETAADGEDPSEELEFPDVPDEEELYVEEIATSSDGRHRVVVQDPTGEGVPYLLNADAPRAIVLRQPAGGLGMECGLDYDEEYGETFYCDAEVSFAPDESSFIVGGGEGTASYDLTGRRLGTARPVTWMRYTPDGSGVLALFRDGALSLMGTNLRPTGVVLRARDGMRSYTSFDETGNLLVAVRGAALVIYDVAANSRKQLITLPSRSTTTPTFTDDGLVQVQLDDAFIWYSVEDGTEARKIEVDQVRGIDASREHVVYCKDDRLRHRTLSDEGDGMDLGPCPQVARELAFDDERVWWVEGSRGHVVRLSDAEHLIVGVYQSRRPLLYAFTPRGHFWTNRPDALRALRVRMPGPVLDADNPVPEAGWIRQTLVADFLTDTDLGEPPEH